MTPLPLVRATDNRPRPARREGAPTWCRYRVVPRAAPHGRRADPARLLSHPAARGSALPRAGRARRGPSWRAGRVVGGGELVEVGEGGGEEALPEGPCGGVQAGGGERGEGQVEVGGGAA